MKTRIIDQGTWIVVCDGRKAVILENIGDRVYPNLKVTETSEHDDLPSHLQGSDSPGRVYASVGMSRSSVEQTDWHDQAERAFTHRIADRLDRALRERETKSLIVVAPPRALGMLREAFTDRVRAAVLEEIDHDLVKVPTSEIERRLVG